MSISKIAMIVFFGLYALQIVVNIPSVVFMITAGVIAVALIADK